MDSYISSELIEHLRSNQVRLRAELAKLSRSARSAGAEPLIAQVDRLATMLDAHERLVSALLDAVEPDLPSSPNPLRGL